MALRTLMSKEWVPSPRTNLSPRTARRPRDERARVPKSPHRGRPPPIQLLAPPLSSNDNNKHKPIPPRDPDIVDLAPPSTWPRRLRLQPPPVPPKQAPLLTRKKNTPSLYSRHSTAAQSEISFGILDYYTRDPSPLQSPELPPPPPPPPSVIKVEGVMNRPGLGKFDFELVPCTPSKSGVRDVGRKPLPISKGEDDAVAGAVVEDTPVKATSNGGKGGMGSTVAGEIEVEQPTHVNITPPTRKAPDVPPHKRTYSLFPAAAIKEKTPSPPTTEIIHSTLPISPAASPTNKPAMHYHQKPASSYRPRKESLTGSVRSRKDSFTSLRSSRRIIPLRVLSSTSSTGSASRSYRTFSTTSTSASTASPSERGGGGGGRGSDVKGEIYRSRWSDDTITSPTAATTPGPRTSFGSLLRDFSGGGGGGGGSSRRSESGQYPACFFEVDEEEEEGGDEGVPLRRKLRDWKGSGSGSGSVTVRETRRCSKGRFDEPLGFGERVRRFVLCGGCAGGDRGGGGGRRAKARGRAGTV
ncbi:hypothetical protein LTR86_007713 [Recurvomyces mirabilis]|nr:hypothetical protein LTR86_007713 [Recurvomyces mirabilis]